MTSPSNPQDYADRFLIADTRTRMTLVRDPAATDALRSLLGTAAYDELAALAGPPDQHHLADAPPTNLVFVPGVMGSTLASTGLGGIWWLDIRSRNRINNLALAPDGKNDAHPAYKVSPVAVDATYEGFLFAAEKRSDFQHVAFPYDWRKPFHTSADNLYEAVRAARHEKSPVHIVAHSMGGLVVRTALMRHPDMWNLIGKIVFLGTPHYGSPSIGGYLKNHLWGHDFLALLGKYLSRETFRSLSGVLNLLPAPTGVYPETTNRKDSAEDATEYDHPCANFDLYNAAAWHLKLNHAQELQLQSLLDAAAQHHSELHAWHNALDQRQRDRMAVIAGTGFKTLFRLAYNKRMGFLWQHMDRITTRAPHAPHRDGDGRVPLASATLPWVGETRYINGEHGSLPNLTPVQQDVWSFLADKPLRLATSPQAAMGEHLASDVPRISALALPQLPAQASPDDPGYLNITGPTANTLNVLDEQLEAGSLPEFMRTRLL